MIKTKISIDEIKEKFLHFWQKNYNGIPIIGYVLKQYFSDKWFRIHSLPNSKRYADTEDEMKIILDRQNALIGDLIGEQQKYLLFLSAYSENPKLECFSGVDGAIILDTIQLSKVLPEHFEDDYYFHTAIIEKQWRAGSIDNYLRAVANDEDIIAICSMDYYPIYRFSIVDTEKNIIISPYDGGMDIFLNNTHERDAVKSKYKGWLSFTESGL
jgi:hypothetical protein